MSVPEQIRPPSLRSVHAAGAVTVAGGAVLTAAVLFDGTAGAVLSERRDHPVAWQHSVRAASLLVGWGLLFVASVVAARERHAHGRLWRVGNAWTAVGFGVVTAGLAVAALGLLPGATTASHVGTAAAQVGMVVGVGPGSVLYGLAWAREAAVARSATTPLSLAGVLLSLTAVGFVGSLALRVIVLPTVVPPTVERGLFLALPLGWLVFGVTWWASVRGTP
jgi:hypothetical protein